MAKHYMMQFFEYKHLPEHLQKVSKPFRDTAITMDIVLPNNPEKSAALRKLLEAKDCAVRAMLFKTGEEDETNNSRGEGSQDQPQLS